MFGSCLDETRAHTTLSVVVDRSPDLFVFLGDNVYADNPDPAVIRRSYETLGASRLFQALRSTTRVMATWDDHDYGRNDAGREFSAREESERIFEEFWDIPAAATARPGIYHVAEFGPADRRVQVIVLDTRFFRTPLPRARPRPAGKGPYAVGTGDGSLLGAAQWEWLAGVLAHPAEVRVIASSIQVLASHHGWESWANYPRERERLLEMVAVAGVPTIFISGDRHFAEMSVERVASGTTAVTMLDVTSSGINRRYPEAVPTTNANRVDGYYLQYNVGELQIDWSTGGGIPSVRARIYDTSGAVRLEHQVSWDGWNSRSR